MATNKTTASYIAILCKHLRESEICEHCGLMPRWWDIEEKPDLGYSWTHRLAREATDKHTLLVVGTDWNRQFPGDMIELSGKWKLKPLALVIEKPSKQHKAGRLWTMEVNGTPERIW